VLVGVNFLKQGGVDYIALVGHSFGGAVVIMAATMSTEVKAVVGLSSQTYGTGLATSSENATRSCMSCLEAGSSTS
jgi:dienelactone hydrolase